VGARPVARHRGEPRPRSRLALFSPDCKHFSKAKGGKPVNKRIRGLAWVVVPRAKAVRPRVIILENVEEFQDWGPLADDGRPCPMRRGFTFRRWIAQLRNLGYQVEWRELRACDFGAPTTVGDIDEWFDYLADQFIEIGNTIMAKLEDLSTDTAAANAAVAKFISDVNTEVGSLAQQIADLKAQLGAAGTLTADQQALVDQADANAQAVSAAVADASSKLSPVA
jgi:hypothetical protein